jgi:hypothetical protein
VESFLDHRPVSRCGVCVALDDYTPPDCALVVQASSERRRSDDRVAACRLGVDGAVSTSGGRFTAGQPWTQGAISLDNHP